MISSICSKVRLWLWPYSAAQQPVQRMLQAAVGSIEPVMVGLLSVVIGGILLSVMLPLLGALSAIG